jgi:hypothetical protein
MGAFELGMIGGAAHTPEAHLPAEPAPPYMEARMMVDSQLNRVFLSKLTERMVRMRMVALPGFGGFDQETLRELRTPEPQAMPESQLAPAAI